MLTYPLSANRAQALDINKKRVIVDREEHL